MYKLDRFIIVKYFTLYYAVFKLTMGLSQISTVAVYSQPHQNKRQFKLKISL